ncbi:hypothetical protein KAFR_0A01700 [Kazachstania africana CBS 2517]|uniref:Protein BTN n=1 Tax=Kazachstania africana (strain ATCC 22294 / BCRC 22015 / CBS 2517 / CECT 1963 / NBRC 1671 / NRRL Y-8276) TaxID=1071382 RepID=H2AMK8_KAZAF|nr:hypothetical protein KAFR_0A01700 [Kazachstania africana CBS 2517]CCF55608.1 hypothetical protein KAFR_0A01700 [Kazachstania africana CBS 2517]
MENSRQNTQAINSPKTNRILFIYFWIFGLINNVLYVVILSAAMDIVGPKLPKSLVLLADILPSLSIKVLAPFFIHKIQYSFRVISLIFLSCLGMFLVSTKSIGVCLSGVVLASVSSGFGEITFLQLTNNYGLTALSGWSSGTGGAGLFGSGVYMFLTSILHIPVNVALLLFAILPTGFLCYYNLISTEYSSLNASENENEIVPVLDHYQAQEYEEDSNNSTSPKIDPTKQLLDSGNFSSLLRHVIHTCKRLQNLVIPYMVPLTTVYLFEYLINQAVAPTLLFSLNADERKSIPFFFHKYKDIYVTYGAIYQLGVFISRSSAQLMRLNNLYLLSCLQAINFVILILQSIFFCLKTPWLIMLLILYEGLLGGASYVNTFLNVLESKLDSSETEFALGAVSIADSFGVFIAALVGLKLEPSLCQYQVSNGRPWCNME